MSDLIIEVCKIEKVKEHPNADRLEIVIVKGWKIIVAKGMYSVGDEIVYVPVDSIFPQELSDKMDITKYLKKGRVRPAKLRGIVSFGVIMPNEHNDPVGTDVSEKYGITKWNPYEFFEKQEEKKRLSKIRQRKRDCYKYCINTVTKTNYLNSFIETIIPFLLRKEFPAIPNVPGLYNHPLFFKYTDIQNIRNFPNLFSEDDEIIITEKIHGMNTRYGLYFDGDNPNGKFVVGSHNVQKDDNSYGSWGIIADKAEELLRWMKKEIYPKAKSIIAYGEVFGTGIQPMNYNCKIDFRVFDISIDGNYINYYKMKLYCEELGINVVPVIYEGKYNYKNIIEMTSGNSVINNYNHYREGLVVGLKEEESHWKDRGMRKKLKSISNEYYLSKHDTGKH